MCIWRAAALQPFPMHCWRVWAGISQQLWPLCSSPGGPASAALKEPQEILVGAFGCVPGTVWAPEAAALRFDNRAEIWMLLFWASLLSVSKFY